jgi:hypothetical protein
VFDIENLDVYVEYFCVSEIFLYVSSVGFC